MGPGAKNIICQASFTIILRKSQEFSLEYVRPLCYGYLMTKIMQVTDNDLGLWLDAKSYDSFELFLVSVIRMAQEYGFEFSNQQSFDDAVPSIISQDMDDELEIALVFLVRDAVEYLNEYIIPNGFLFQFDERGLTLMKWS